MKALKAQKERPTAAKQWPLQFGTPVWEGACASINIDQTLPAP
jgi:hypothetical protein